MRQPLLIAWRPRSLGFWLLFDPSIATPVDNDFLAVDLDMAAKNDLMSVLAGDYFLVPMEGAGLRFEFERIGEKQPTADGYQAMFQVTGANLQDAAGVRTKGVPNSVVWAIFSTLKDHQEVSEDGIVQSFVASGGFTRAQLVLRTAIGFSLKANERIHWKSVATNLDAALSCDTLLTDSAAHIGTFMSYIFHQQPQGVPTFIPHDWVGRTDRDGG
jgi:hypothetical protein